MWKTEAGVAATPQRFEWICHILGLNEIDTQLAWMRRNAQMLRI